jgi:hypothetical protein
VRLINWWAGARGRPSAGGIAPAAGAGACRARHEPGPLVWIATNPPSERGRQSLSTSRESPGRERAGGREPASDAHADPGFHIRGD